MDHIRIAHKRIGKSQSCFIIAEMGSNHDGKISQAKELIDIAAWAGCNAVKIQIPIAEEAYPPGTIFGGIYGKKNIRSIIKKNEIPPEWLPRLVRYAHSKEIAIGASTDGFIGLEMITKNKIDFVKIPSFTISNIPLLKLAAKTKVPWLLSTGAHTLGQIEEALEAVNPAPVALFHCISSYPLKLKDSNLATIPFLKQVFDIPVGFSDHSLHPEHGPVVAAALGANLLEKHFTINRKLKGTDHFFALEPKELKHMVVAVRNIESNPQYAHEILRNDKYKQLMGKVRNGVFSCEKKNSKKTRLGLYFLKNLKAGDILRKTHVRVLRCADSQVGLHPRYMELIIGAGLVCDVAEFNAVQWDHFIYRRGS